MLVLTRKLQEKIRIGDHITITVLRTKGKAVRLGIEAPADVSVIRGELAFDSGGRQSTHASAGEEAAATTCLTMTDELPRESNSRRERPPWPTVSRSDRPAAVPPGVPPTQVHLERVPRRKLAGVLASPTTATGPLRAMLDRRTTTT